MKNTFFYDLLIIAIIFTNCIIFKNLKIKLQKNKFLKLIFGILLIKLFLSLKMGTGEVRLETYYGIDKIILIIKKTLEFTMALYAINKIINKNIYRKIFYFIFILIFIESILISSTIIDFTKLILLIFIFKFFNFRKKIERRHYLPWIFIFISLVLMEYSIYFLPKFMNGYYFIELMEFICLYWLLVFFTTRVYYKRISICTRLMATFVISYTVLFYTKSISSAYIVLITEVFLEFYTWLIKNITSKNGTQVEDLFSNLSLTNSIEEFQDQLAFQLKNILQIDHVTVLLFKYEEDFFKYIYKNSANKNIFTKEDIKLKNFTTGFRISFNNNLQLGLIFITETSYFLSLSEFNFILELCDKVASQGNKVRLNTLYKELQ